jgi:hypothetical protein
MQEAASALAFDGEIEKHLATVVMDLEPGSDSPVTEDESATLPLRYHDLADCLVKPASSHRLDAIQTERSACYDELDSRRQFVLVEVIAPDAVDDGTACR